MDYQTQSRRESFSFTTSSTSKPSESQDTCFDLEWPFGNIEGLDKEDLRETAYEIFFTACRSSPGFGGKTPLIQDSCTGDNGGIGHNGGRTTTNGLGLAATSKVKRALGLKMVKKVSPRKPNSNPSSPRPNSGFVCGGGLGFTTPLMRLKRPLTSAEIMRSQMKVSEQRDIKLRKTLMRTLVGQMGRRVETIIIPLELLRHLKTSEFSSVNDYHLMQRRQLKVLEAGLLLYPSVPLEPSNSSVLHLQDIIRGSEEKPIDASNNSETMRMLCNSVVSLSLRSTNGSTADACHWADGYPMNIHLYCLLQSVFDLKDETAVLDGVDELLELMNKTWSTLGVNKCIHNVCFMWVLFQQYIATAQVEQDLLSASLAMLTEVVNDVKKAERRDVIYNKLLSSAATSMLAWSEKRLLNYHDNFQKGMSGLIMENLLPLALSAARILDEDVSNFGVGQGRGDGSVEMGNKVDNYIRSSMRSAFDKLFNGAKNKNTEAEEEASEVLIQLAKETQELATKEKENFSPILKKWHPVAAGVASLSLHNCFGEVLKQYIAQVSTLTNEAIRVLQTAGKLEKDLIQMAIEESIDCEEGGKVVLREMEAYEVDSIILSLLKAWIYERLKNGNLCLGRAKETETWNPKSKTEPYAQSAVEIMKLVHQSVDDFFEIPVGISDGLVQDLVDSLELLILDYTSFVASCGSKQSYIPPLPSLTRCNQHSKFIQLWRKASPCRTLGAAERFQSSSAEGNHPRPSTSRGTQRLYIRLNTLQYLLSYVHSLDKSLSLARRQNPLPHSRYRNNRHISANQCYYYLARSSILAASENVAEIGAYRLIFLDSSSVFYESLYVGDVANARIRPALRILKQNLTLLAAILMDQVQPLAVKEIMKATFEVYLMILLAGGVARGFSLTDQEMIEEDFESLKRAFCSCGEGLVAEEVVEREVEVVEGVLGLMGQNTEQLIEGFSIAACEVSGLGIMGVGQKVPMPPTTGRWNRADPNTILRVLCHRNDSTANGFLKRTFQLAKRK
ncbi:hypothetical protein MKW98_028532 [Papaver atlanticum]|uniref:Uncharacterized protein n=1 Tax=Papaver atlanticum TaxID=357466 RepID=A0AAD4TAL8_9MAGN|nr:hypothetical protein MKW98_028532 [Papaver atlanticum]